MIKMAKQFQFDDENTEVNEETSVEEVIDTQSLEIENQTNESDLESLKDDSSLQVDDVNNGDSNDMAKTKDKKKFVWLWWHYVLLGLFALFIAFFIYIFVVSRNDGPVYGKTRCEGLAVAIEETTLNSVEDEMKAAYNTIENVELAIECKQLKVDIYFKEKMNTKKAQEIAVDAIKRVDDKMGIKKEEGKKYSYLFGIHNDYSQYEVNFTLYSKNNDDFPIFGTKHVQNDTTSFTLHSVKDKTSAEKAQQTLKD